jgi:hypothetical protein
VRCGWTTAAIRAPPTRSWSGGLADIAGTWFIQLANGEPDGATYTLDVEVGPVAPCFVDPFEPNDDAASGALLSGPQSVEGAVCTDDDWFDVPADEGDVLRVAFSSGTRWEIATYEVTHPNGRVVRPDWQNIDIYEVPYTDAGTYQVRVLQIADDIAGGGAEYTLSTEVITRPPCPLDAFEPNDTELDAVPLVPGVYQADGCLADDDWFTIAADVGDTIDVGLLFDATSRLQDVDVALYDPAGALLDQSAFNITTPEFVSATATVAGDYRIRVFAETDDLTNTGIPYELDVQVTP